MQSAEIAVDTLSLSTAARAPGCGIPDCGPIVTPEPATFALLALPVVLVAFVLWRRTRRA